MKPTKPNGISFKEKWSEWLGGDAAAAGITHLFMKRMAGFICCLLWVMAAGAALYRAFTSFRCFINSSIADCLLVSFHLSFQLQASLLSSLIKTIDWVMAWAGLFFIYSLIQSKGSSKSIIPFDWWAVLPALEGRAAHNQLNQQFNSTPKQTNHPF